MEAVPSLLTVEEAARVLRVGRTKAYAMASEWRVTGGKSGLPVIDFGNVLRVPRCQLEALLGGPLTPAGVEASTKEPTPVATPVNIPDANRNDSTTRRPRRTRRLTQSNQQSLFDSLPD